MKKKIINENGKRDKAFIGAIISTINSAIGAGIRRHKQKQQIKEQNAQVKQENEERQQAQYVNDAEAAAQGLEQAYENQDYIKNFEDKVSFKNGGIMNYEDRIKRNKRFACGGRKRKLDGGSFSSAMDKVQAWDEKMDSKLGNNALTNGLADTASTIASNVMTLGKYRTIRAKNPTVNKSDYSGLNKVNYTINSYDRDKDMEFKYGGGKRIKRK